MIFLPRFLETVINVCFFPFLSKFQISISRRCSVILLFCIISYCIITISNINWSWSSHNNVLTLCSISDANIFLRSICKNFSIGIISGSLCMPLCNSNIILQRCLGHGVKDNVILASWGSTQIILKSHHSQLDSKMENDISATSHLFAINLIQQLLSEKYFGLSNNIIFDISKYLLSTFDYYPRGILDKFEMKQLLYFLNDDENFKNYFLNHTGVSPYYFGHCGVLWATTYMRDTNLLWTLSNPQRIVVPWKFQARVAIGFLNLIKNLETVPFGPLHLCDIQLPNFGLQFFNGFPIIRSIDMDATLFHSYLVTYAIDNQNGTCRTDSDCSFFNCRFKCGLINKQCYPRIVSNNFRNICKLIFQKHLLKPIPSVLYSRLYRLLDRCSNGQHDSKIFHELYNLLWLSSDFH